MLIISLIPGVLKITFYDLFIIIRGYYRAEKCWIFTGRHDLLPTVWLTCGPTISSLPTGTNSFLTIIEIILISDLVFSKRSDAMTPLIHTERL